MTYKGCVSYEANGTKCTYEHSGFESVEDATKWIGERFTCLMLHWGEISEHGVTAHAEVCDEGEENSIGFTDCYELYCGC